MKISSKGHYGLLAVAELARHYEERLVSLAEIASAERLPLPYLEQIVAPLRAAGLVEATRGLHGGYRLSRHPSQVSVGEVVRRLEGPIALVECTTEGYVSGTCEREPGCTSRGVWRQVSEAINQVLNTLSLADLIAREDSSSQTLTSLGLAPIGRVPVAHRHAASEESWEAPPALSPSKEALPA